MFAVTAMVDGRAIDIDSIKVLGHQRPEGVTGALPEDQLESAYVLAEQYWARFGFTPSQLRSVLADAEASSLVLGGSPEQWSPLARPDAGSLGRLNSNESLPTVEGDSAYRLRAMNGLLTDGSAWIALERGGLPLAAMAFGADALITFVPRGTDRLLVKTSPQEPWELESEADIHNALRSLVSGRVERHLVWRLYMGDNTLRLDDSTRERRGLHRLRLGGTRLAGVLVGRLLYSIPLDSKKLRGDPLAARRLMLSEARDERTARNCPRLELGIRPVSGVIDKLVVAVHGTMSTAVPMAAAIQALVPPGAPVVRFEHDTWLSIVDNAEDLHASVSRLLCRHVLFVAHSRGGLVARHAAHLLRREGVDASVVSLGSPFAGTPVVDGVERGLLGVRALMGGLRIASSLPGPPDVPVVDPATRLLGWMVRGSMPHGLAQMSPGSEYLKMLSLLDVAPGVAVSGEVNPPFDADSFGVNLLSGFAQAAFGADANDMVVGADSSAAFANRVRVVKSDHFSYLEQPEVLQELKDAVGRLPSGFVRLDAEMPPDPNIDRLER